MYSSMGRIPQYVDYVRAIKTTEYEFYEGADPARIFEMADQLGIKADDSRVSENKDFEDEVIQKVLNKQWFELSKFSIEKNIIQLPLKRKIIFRGVDVVRNKFKRGDL